jgi:hypothetical protein
MDAQRACPYCAEPIKPEAIKCKHCGEMMPGAVRPPAPPDSPAAKDQEHLRLLVIGHFVLAGITALFASIFLLHVGMGILMLVSPESMFHGKEGPPPRLFGWFVILMGSGAVLSGWTLAGLMIAAGRCIRRRTRLLFCQIVAGLSCFFMPFGTALGVCSFLVLNRPGVKALFSPSSSPPRG